MNSKKPPRGFRILKPSEIIAEGEAAERRLSRAVRFVKSRGCITIRGPYQYDVPIPRRRMTCAEILKWTVHLSDKTWMTTELLGAFIRRACEISGIDPDRPQPPERCHHGNTIGRCSVCVGELSDLVDTLTKANTEIRNNLAAKAQRQPTSSTAPSPAPGHS